MIEPEAVETKIVSEEQEQRELRRAAERLASLDTHPGFVLLRSAFAAKKERMRTSAFERVMGGHEALELLQRQIDYDRGFIDALAYAEQVVEGARNKLAQYEEGLAPSEPDEEEDFWSDGRPAEDRST